MSLKNIISIQYGLDIKLMKQLKEGFLIRTARSDYIIKRISLSAAEIVFVYYCQQHLRENGFLNFEKIIPTKDGCPYLRFDKYTYVLLDFFDKKNVKLTEKQVLSCAELINAFHSSSANLNQMVGAKCRVGYGKDRIVARNIYSVFTKIKQNPSIIKNDSLKKTILKSIDENIDFVTHSLQILENDNYLKLIQRSMQENRFIHGRLSTKNIVKKDKKLNLINMFDMELNIREKDIVTFIKSVLKDMDDIEIEEIIELFYIPDYDEYRKKLIMGLLLVPYEYYAVIKKILKLGSFDWANDAFKEKIEKICEKSLFKRKIITSLH